MTTLLYVLGTAARFGRSLLVLGLLVAILFPELAFLMRPALPELIAALLFVAALRVGPGEALRAIPELRKSLVFVIVLQLMLPLAVVPLFLAIGLTGPLPFVLMLMVCASPLLGSPNLTLMVGKDPEPALRHLVVGTAMLPLTVVPVFWLVPELGSMSTVLAAAGRLLLTIGLASGAAFAVRALFLRHPGPDALKAIDGVSAITMAVVVIGLMSAVGPAIWSNPAGLALNLTVAFVANFGLQIFTWAALQRTSWSDYSVPIGISAGNRNVALFLTALPASTTDPLLLFIGCYQIPMYLTPFLLSRMYAGSR